MLINYIKIAIRTLIKYRGYATINLLGLALGLASGILILMHVLDELSFDKFHTKGDRIYRVGTDIVMTKEGTSEGNLDSNGWPVGKLLQRDYPEVETGVYMRNASHLEITQEGRRFTERIFYAGEEFFSIFSFGLQKGNPATALHDPYSIVISQDIEQKYFKGSDALGKTMLLDDTLSFVVTGVMENVPAQSHMQFDMLISFSTFETLNRDFSYEGGWGNLNMRNYILLKEGVDANAFMQKARNLYIDHVEEEMKGWGAVMYVAIEPFQEIYLQSKRGNGMGPLGSLERVYLITGIAVFVILLACINFVNLATARSVFRAKEVGLRKVVGSTRGGLIRQFLSESFVLTVISFVVSLALVGALLPLFNQLVGKSYQFEFLLKPSMIAGIILLILLITLLSGYYPAWIMSALRPAEVLKGKMLNSSRGVRLRRTLVIFQFVISVGLVICTLVVLNQLDFMQKRDLGFKKDQVLVIDASRLSFVELRAFDAFKHDIRTLTTVSNVSFSNAIPGRGGWVGQWAFPEGRPKEESISVEYMAVDEDFIHTLGLNIIAGRNFNANRETDKQEGLLVNETAVSMMGWGSPKNAIGKKISSPSGYPEGTVIGVVKDYHEFGLQQNIGPMVMDYNTRNGRYFAIRYTASNTSDLIESLQGLWKKHFSSHDFQFYFLDEDFARQYQSEQRLAKVFAVFSVVTIVIAAIGLLGLVSFMVASRTKEIGVRKVLGADVFSITKLLSKEFLLLVLLANLIAIPLAWYVSDFWLQSFAYRVNVNPGIFLLTFFIAMVITILTVSYQTIRAALTDPVQSLRYE